MIKQAIRVARDWPPINRPLTQAARATLGPRPRLVKHLPRVGRTSVRLPNGRKLQLESRGDDWISNQVFWRGWHGYEPECSKLFWDLATGSRLTLDIGAHVGFYALLAGHANTSGRVVAFEPIPGPYARLCRHVDLNGLSNVECIRAAVADRDGETRAFHFGALGVPCSSSLSQEWMRRWGQPDDFPVETVTIDSRLSGPVDLVKIDTETTEPEVLSGMLGTIGRCRPSILCEVLPIDNIGQRIGRLLEPLDYAFLHLRPNPTRESQPVGHHEWFNWLFVPADQADRFGGS